MAINGDWYNLQSTRLYPLADTATSIDDNGLSLATDILVDCQLRLPVSYGQAYVAAVTVTPTLVTVIIAGDSGAILAAMNILQPVAPGVSYPVQAVLPGIGGWFVFGPGVAVPQSYRFSSKQQSALLARCAAGYLPPNVTSMAKSDQTTLLSGIVNFKDGTDITVTSEKIFALGKSRNAVVFSLTADNLQRNALEIYNSPCEPRPESGNCNNVGVQFINSVPPDCKGNINIIFQGLVPSAYSEPQQGAVLQAVQSWITNTAWQSCALWQTTSKNQLSLTIAVRRSTQNQVFRQQ